jgi:hypothetical protein
MRLLASARQVPSISEQAGAGAAPATANPNEQERAELFRSLVAYSSTYKIDGTKLVQRVEASWVQSWTGTERSATVEVTGNKLVLTSQPFKSTVTGQDVVTTTTCERVE